jgi:hypothetical protein
MWTEIEIQLIRDDRCWTRTRSPFNPNSVKGNYVVFGEKARFYRCKKEAEHTYVVYSLSCKVDAAFATTTTLKLNDFYL